MPGPSPASSPLVGGQKEKEDSFTRRLGKQAARLLGTDMVDQSFRSSTNKSSATRVVDAEGEDAEETDAADVTLQRWTLRFPDEAIESAFVARSFRGYYEVHQSVTVHLSVIYFVAFSYGQQDGLRGALAIVLAGLLSLGARSWLHALPDRRRAQRLGKRAVLAASYLSFGATALASSTRELSVSALFLGLYCVALVLFCLFVHTWTLTFEERLGMFAFMLT